MQTIPAKLQANLATYGCHISEEVNRSAGSKQRGTSNTRTNHFLKWYKRMDGIGDPCMPTAPIQARNYVIACYAVSLIRGETILNMKIRYKTVCNYVTDAIKLHTSQTGNVTKLPNPRNADINYIDIVLKAVKKYETMADRREMIYDDMVLKMIR